MHSQYSYDPEPGPERVTGGWGSIDGREAEPEAAVEPKSIPFVVFLDSCKDLATSEISFPGLNTRKVVVKK